MIIICQFNKNNFCLWRGTAARLFLLPMVIVKGPKLVVSNIGLEQGWVEEKAIGIRLDNGKRV